MLIVACEGQYRYTPEQAQALAESLGYEDGSDLMADRDYFCCADCGDYVVEPSGWSEEYHGVLCNKCAPVEVEA